MKENVTIEKRIASKAFKNIRIVGITMLFIALVSLPYAYYQILRWVVCGIAVYSAYLATQYVSRGEEELNGKDSGWTIIFIVIAILYNPLAPIHLDKSMWTVLNIVTAITIIISLSKLGYRLVPSSGQKPDK